MTAIETDLLGPLPVARGGTASATGGSSTWTPVIGGSGGTSGQTYGTQTGIYVKVGRFVIAWFDVTLTAKGTITTSVQIQGLPFTADAQGAVAVSYWENLATNVVFVSGLVLNGGTAATIYGTVAAAANLSALDTTYIANNTRIVGVATYRTAS